ncbi:MAG: NUDIX hydrolase [Ectothiorhodospiraceae bacterium]|nr:NUDIX hydrolase [Ectothiorhodospiraceae bacterium]
MPVPITPKLTVDIIIELVDQSTRPILLIERKYPPLGWALPGGFVDVGETLEQAALREAMEEISLDVTLTTLLGCYSDPARDPRNHTVSAVYVAEARGKPCAADDAAAVQEYLPTALPASLAFDHGLILSDYLKFRQRGELTPIRT